MSADGKLTMQQFRESLGLSQHAMAAELGCHRSVYSAAECGYARLKIEAAAKLHTMSNGAVHITEDYPCLTGLVP